MIHEYIDAENVTLSRKNYDCIKDGYDAGYKHASDETLEVIEDLEKRNEKLRSSICIIKYVSVRWEISGTLEPYSIDSYGEEFCKDRASFYIAAKAHIGDFNKLRDRIEKFQSSFIGKLLNFFGVKL